VCVLTRANNAHSELASRQVVFDDGGLIELLPDVAADSLEVSHVEHFACAFDALARALGDRLDEHREARQDGAAAFGQ